MEQKIMRRCPKCGATEFIVTAHVTQDWKVAHDGEFMSMVTACVEVTHKPDDDDIWGCAQCGHEASGNTFMVNNEQGDNV